MSIKKNNFLPSLTIKVMVSWALSLSSPPHPQISAPAACHVGSWQAL